ncbi:MAG TPA: hypothetical protein V6D07_00290 [Trichocoleus sp.]
MTAVTPLNSRTVLGLNQEAYQQLRLALTLNLRRQLLIAVCDDTALQGQLAARLEDELSGQEDSAEGAAESAPTVVSLRLESQAPDLVRQVVLWIKQHGLTPAGKLRSTPTFQILGIDRLTRHSPAVQNRFLESLSQLETLLARLDLRLVLWVSRPWLRKIRQSTPDVWRLRNGLFEFVGDPTPLTPAEAMPGLSLPKKPKPNRSANPPKSSGPQAVLTSAPEDFWTILTEDLSALEETVVPKRARIVSTQEKKPVIAPSLEQAPPATDVPSGLDLPQSSSQVEPVVEPVSDLNQIAPADVLETTPITPPPTPTAPVASKAKTSSVLETAQGEWADSELMALMQQIQGLIQQQVEPSALARAYLLLGQTCRDRIESGNTTPALIDLAIEAYTQALPAFTPGAAEWCDSLNDLGSLYWLRSHSETQPEAVAQWLHQSIDAYQQALNHPQSQPSSDGLARMCSNLGTVYSLLANLQAPKQNLEQAVRAYHRALQHCPAETFPVEYASLQNSLGAVHWRLSQLGDTRQQLHRAITAYGEALRHRPPQTYPQEYAMIQNNLGIAYWSLAHHERPVFLLEQSIVAYQAALAYRTLTLDPAGCAATHNNLGTAYWDLAQRQTQDLERQQSLWQKSVDAYEGALEAAHRTLEKFPATALNFDLWATFHSAGVVHDQLAQRLPGDQDGRRSHHLDQALFYYLTALEGWRSQPDRLALIKTALIHNIRLQFQLRGLEGQNAALSRIPGNLLPDILPQL